LQELKAKLVVRIREGFQEAGERFFSNRDLAQRFGISYQTAHRLIAELTKEGYLVRRRGSGTYLAGKPKKLRGVHLFFNMRAQRPGSLGRRLLEELQRRLREEKIRSVVMGTEGTVKLHPEWFPVLWESPPILAQVVASRRYGLLLNDRPEPGLAASYIDSAAIDDFSGGVCAAQLIRQRLKTSARLAVLAGPLDDARSAQRVEGFRSLFPEAKIFGAGTWFKEEAQPVALAVLRQDMAGVFCCNDRLAQAMVETSRRHHLTCPYLVGFDDAPIAEQLGLDTIAVPREELVEASLQIIRKRLRGESGTAGRQILAPRPVIRSGG
jgi:DNA-binding transcriptional regulator YhcF (GntR family)